jgi:hypothetical protein
MLLLRPHTASGLVDCNPIMRRTLAQVVHDNDGLKRTRDFTRQGREGIVAREAITSLILMVIDTLDVSAKPREQIFVGLLAS